MWYIWDHNWEWMGYMCSLSLPGKLARPLQLGKQRAHCQQTSHPQPSLKPSLITEWATAKSCSNAHLRRLPDCFGKENVKEYVLEVGAADAHKAGSIIKASAGANDEVAMVGYILDPGSALWVQWGTIPLSYLGQGTGIPTWLKLFIPIF